jgi:hypothetical protein
MQSDHDRGQAMFLGDGNAIPGFVLVLEMIKEAAALGGGYRKENELNCSFSRLSSSSGLDSLLRVPLLPQSSKVRCYHKPPLYRSPDPHRRQRDVT